MQPPGEPAIRRQHVLVRKADAIRETRTDLLEQVLKRLDGIGAEDDEARRGESFPGTERFQLIQ